MARPVGTGGKAKELSHDEILRIDKIITGTAHELRDRAIIYWGMGSGMRISEIVGLRTTDVRDPAGKILLEVVLEKNRVKEGKSKTVSIHPQARKYMGQWLAYRDEHYPENKHEYVFPAPRGVGPLSPTAAINLLAVIFKAAGIPHASSHSLRRTHANMLRRSGADLKIIQEQLGHSSLAITEKYFSVDPIEKSQAVDRLKF